MGKERENGEREGNKTDVGDPQGQKKYPAFIDGWTAKRVLRWLWRLFECGPGEWTRSSARNMTCARDGWLSYVILTSRETTSVA